MIRRKHRGFALIRLSCLVLVAGSLLFATACSEDSTGLGTGANFGGIWDFDLTLVGEGCPGAESGRDCFRILQTGDDLVIVDDRSGNITGVVTGNRASMERQTVGKEAVFLELIINPASGVITGSAVEADSMLGCTNNLTLVGNRRATACGGKQE